MRVLGPLLWGWCLVVASADAQDRRFPYEAIVDVDEEFVRSGQGPRYYPTGKLSRGDKVIVHRHDPGGWYMISPPAGSFSWIQSEYVQRMADGRGRLIANNVIVHVGSSLADERSVYQRTLSKGDTVEILGEATVDTERGPVSLYKIKPPAREYRWIAGKAVVPAGNGTGKPQPKFQPNVPPAPSIKGPIALELDPSDDAFAPSPFQTESEQGPQPALKTGEQSPKLAPEGSLEAQREQLHELDRQFREMIQQEPATWTLATLEASYQALDRAAGDESLHASVAQRLRTLQKYARIQKDYEDFHRLSMETKQRDAQLASLQKQLESGAGSPSDAASFSPPATGALGGVYDGVTPSLGSTPPNPPSERGGENAGPAKRAKPPGAKFDGAGIIERAASPPGAPPFALVAPDGRLLAYLQPPAGLDLNRYLRQSMGIYGERSYHAELKADLIIIRGMQPVRLQTRP